MIQVKNLDVGSTFATQNFRILVAYMGACRLEVATFQYPLPNFTSFILGKEFLVVVVSTQLKINDQIGSFNPDLTMVSMFTTELFIIFEP